MADTETIADIPSATQSAEREMGYTPVHNEEPPKRENPDVYDSGNIDADIRAYSAERDQRDKERGPQSFDEITTKPDLYLNPDGSKVDKNKSVTQEEFTKDYGEFKRREGEAVQNILDQNLTAEIDAARFAHHYESNPEYKAAVDAAVQQQAAHQQTQQPAQPEQPQQQQPDLAADWENTPASVKKAVEEIHQGVTQSQQTYAQATQEHAAAAAAALLASFPELQGLSAQQLPIAVDLIAKQNPERGLEIKAHIAQVRAIYDQAFQAQAAEQQRRQEAHRAQWDQFSKAEDAKFDQRFPEYSKDPKIQREISDLVVKSMENVGITRGDLMKAYNGQLAFSARDARVQEIMVKAALYDQAKANIAHPDPPRRAVPMQRPGVITPSVSGTDAQVAAAKAQFHKTGSPNDYRRYRDALDRSRG
jgi:hypothetical protein